MKTLSTAVLAVLLLAAVPAGAAGVATINGEPVSMEELETSVRAQLAEVENQRFQILEGGLVQLIAEKVFELEAKTLDTTVEALLHSEIESNIVEPSAEQIEVVFEKNKEQLGEVDRAEVDPRIIAYLKTGTRAELTRSYVDALRKKYEVSISLTPPTVEIGPGSLPGRGGDENAPITIIGFSDYECPYCSVVEETVKKVIAHYGDKVRYVHRDFPLPFHANAHPAAQASRCANAQGKFWEYHDALFEQTSLSAEVFSTIAESLTLDKAAFDKCMADEEFGAAVDADAAAGAAVGVTGTPAFFVNGRMMGGAQPLEAFQGVINDQLARQANAAAGQ